MDWRKGRPPRWSSPAANDNIVRTPRGPPGENIVRTPRGPPGEASSSHPVRGAASGYGGRGNYQNDSRPPSRGDYRGGRAGYSSRQPTKGSLDSRLLLTLSNENTEPSEIIRHLGNEGSFNLALVEHLNDFDYLELILLALGNFCKKNGPTQFHSEFCPIVLLLFKHRVLSQVTAIIIQTSISREMTLQKGDRLKRLIRAVYHLASDIIVMLPSVACNFLGEDFFTNILSLKEMPSIQKLNISDAFDILLPAVERLKVAWDQHGRSQNDNPVEIRQIRAAEAYNDVMMTQKPPDDFRTLNIMPNWNDIFIQEEPFLRANLIKGAYPDAETYLDVQFRLLREDFFQPLRIGLQKYKAKMEHKQITRGRVDNVRPYYDVKFIGHDLHLDTFTLQFNTRGLERIVWEGSKRLLYGALLFLSSDDFASFYLFTVVDRKAEELVGGRIKVQFEGDTLPTDYKHQTYVMIESTVFYEAYRSVLVSLQRISPTHFPMEDYILGRKVNPEIPDYLRNHLDDKPVYNLGRVRVALNYGNSPEVEPENSTDDEDDETKKEEEIELKNRLENVEILDISKHLRPEDLDLDASQTAAFYAALTQKLTVIQGPPGTGKTYLGLRIVQTLLQNRKYWSDRFDKNPILVICYTNHALDQFLEGIMKFTDKIVRIGGQSKCDALNPFSLWEQKKRASRDDISREIRQFIFETRLNLENYSKALEQNRALLNNLNSFDIIHEMSLREMKILPSSIYDKFRALLKNLPRDYPQSSLCFWLLIHSNTDMERVLDEFKSRNKNKPTKKSSPFPTAGVKQTADDQWDKEDIEAIEAERFVDTGGNELPFRSTKQSIKNETVRQYFVPSGADLEGESLHYAFVTSTEDEQIGQCKSALENAEGDDVTWYYEEINRLEKRASLVSQLLENAPTVDDDKINQWCSGHLNSLTLTQRWILYASWKRKAIALIEEGSRKLEKKYRDFVKRLEVLRAQESAEVCSQLDVVGITTTGAAKQRGFLDRLRAKIVIVEEAAEVLEAHTVTALSTSCQQLILIGDHQQLRPTTTVFRLAKDYFLDVSFFERLIRNGMKPCVLALQHRMRPEVARLIVPAIYPSLENHPSVLEYPDILGIESNVFFLSHTEMEVADGEGKSHLNPYEADVALALARHLIMQGYSPGQITILTTYSGQLLHMRKLRKQQSSLLPVRISVVDNFQGEENDIIILSLVRSNPDESIGFLRIENRICVALSRAKKGFYMIGNMDNLQGKSKLWDKISRILTDHNQLGSHLPLHCDVHRVSTPVRHVTEFPPEGGCKEKCLVKMLCGHVCPMLCHARDRDHDEFKCMEKCTRRCPEGHSCVKRCSDTCLCRVKVIKALLCQHQQEVECNKKPADVYCLTKMLKNLVHCDHQMELMCGTCPSGAQCPELCGMELDCGHLCPLKCHKKSSHDEIPCRQLCKRTCPEGHPCMNECREQCSNCLTPMIKKLPCDHEKEIECFRSTQDVFCNVKVEKVLSNCQHTTEMNCSQSTDGFKCRELCNKILCKEGHVCKKKCYEPCGKCCVRMNREYKCGHKAMLECYVDPATAICRVPKQTFLPFCQHSVEINCGEDPAEAHCKMRCDVRLQDCGHSCTMNCHIQRDPDHREYKCKRQCERLKMGCKKDHRCGRKCFEDCDPCMEKWNRTLPCGHSSFVECNLNDDDIFCRSIVTKTIAECQHQVNIECSSIPKRKDCKMPCEIVLECGHRCKKRCSEPCSSEDCVELVTTEEMNICNHKIAIPCNDFNAGGGKVTDILKAQHLNSCSEPCGAILTCEHQCRGSCGSCFNGRVHRACQQDCGRTLVCGHSCKINCAASCPPCTGLCDFKCQHSKCRHKCCEPCSPCKERCPWRCEHFSCTRKCGDQCDRLPCNAPCLKLLKCQHPCVGLCGELCPLLCRVCNKEELTEMLFGSEEDDDARFVLLPDCGHCIEVTGMDQWMAEEANNGQIVKKCCPKCKTPIRECLRYGNVTKAILHDIVSVKRKLFNLRGNPEAFYKNANASLKLASSMLMSSLDPKIDHSLFPAINQTLTSIRLLLEPVKVKGKLKNPSHEPTKRYFMQVNLDFIRRLLELFKVPTRTDRTEEGRLRLAAASKISITMNPDLHAKLCDELLKLLKLLTNRDSIMEEDYQDITREVERLELIKAHFMLQSAGQFASIGSKSTEQVLLDQQLTRNVKVLNTEETASIKTALQSLAKKLDTGIGISDAERIEILRAFPGMGQGHWFKCRNGHVYVITECGGAMEESRCNECGARIGGGSHRLLTDNQLATEMDGAVRPAFPG